MVGCAIDGDSSIGVNGFSGSSRSTMVVGMLWIGGLSDRSLVFVDCKDATLDSSEVFGVDLFEGVPLQLWCKLSGSVVDGDGTSRAREELDKAGISGID